MFQDCRWLSGVTVLAALTVCTPCFAQGKLSSQNQQHLMSYVNTSNTLKLMEDPLVKPHLAHMLGPQVEHLEGNLDVSGPIGVDAGMLTLAGNAQNMGLEGKRISGYQSLQRRGLRLPADAWKIRVLRQRDHV